MWLEDLFVSPRAVRGQGHRPRRCWRTSAACRGRARVRARGVVGARLERTRRSGSTRALGAQPDGRVDDVYRLTGDSLQRLAQEVVRTFRSAHTAGLQARTTTVTTVARPPRTASAWPSTFTLSQRFSDLAVGAR